MIMLFSFTQYFFPLLIISILSLKKSIIIFFHNLLHLLLIYLYKKRLALKTESFLQDRQIYLKAYLSDIKS